MAAASIRNIVVEGITDEAVLRRILVNTELCCGRVFGFQGKQHILSHLSRYSFAARHFPILVVVVLTLGYVAALVGQASEVVAGPAAGAAAAAGGTLMYFPMLTDTALVKSFGWRSGPAMVVLLAAPGLSLPGMFAAAKEVGVKRVVCYAAFVAVLAFALGMLYGLL